MTIKDRVIEEAVLRESEDSLRELAQVFENVGLEKTQIAMMLRAVAEDIDPEGRILLN